MDLFEVERHETVSRKEAATRLRRLANLLANEEDEVVFERGGMEFKVVMPENVNLKVELEIGSDGKELEIELTW